MRVDLPPSNDPRMEQAASALRACVHCGMCNSACPTYALTGSELDGPRGRIYLIKNLLEGEEQSAAVVLRHLDNCLTCMACAEACPSKVDYAHLLDFGREKAEEQNPRPFWEHLLRWLLSLILTRPRLFALTIAIARLLRPLRAFLPQFVRAPLDALPPPPPRLSPLPPSAPPPSPPPSPAPPNLATAGKSVLLLDGCVQQTLAPQINASVAALLGRRGIKILSCGKVGCCGALQWHLGFHAAARKRARRNMRFWLRHADANTADTLLVTASGCAAALRDYPSWFPHDAQAREDAQRLAAMTWEAGEYLHSLPNTPPPRNAPPAPDGRNIGDIAVAWHAPCSLTNGGRFHDRGRELLTQAGFSLCAPPPSAACCGAAGAYHLLRPHLSRPLARNKAAEFAALSPDIIATANIGCLLQIRAASDIPVVHVGELLNWAQGGPPPPLMKQ